MNIREYLSERREIVEKALDEMLPDADTKPQVLHSAMRYSVFAGGKRIRPVLAIAAAEAVGGGAANVLPLATAIECIHTYSLIHDDLPAMDDDDIRRGKPSLHKAFGEATAILAGDALLTFAFEILTSPSAERICPPSRLLAVINELAWAAGSRKLVAGQVVDMMSEGAVASADTVDFIVKSKTGALIRASLTCGAAMAGAEPWQMEILGRFGEDLGVVFQTRDDLLDIEGDPLLMGKAVKKDQQRGKLTYPRVLGKEESKIMVRRLIDSAVVSVEALGPRAEPLALIGKYLGERIA